MNVKVLRNAPTGGRTKIDTNIEPLRLIYRLHYLNTNCDYRPELLCFLRGEILEISNFTVGQDE
jgi:hypothetical protein